MNLLQSVDIKDIVLGLYAPLVVLALNAVFRYGGLLYGIVLRGEFRCRDHALWLVIVFLFIGLTIENIFWGLSRSLNLEQYISATARAGIVLVTKLLYVASGVFAAVAYFSFAYGRNTIGRSLLFVAVLWITATLAAARWL